MRVVFMGTSAFATPVLERLIESKHTIVAVYTKPPSRQSRGMAYHKSLVHAIAEKNNLPVLSPKSFKDRLEVETFRNLRADVAIVAAYGLIIPKSLLEGCKFGCINIHPSDLPRWRGAAPIQRSMMAGDDNTAICIMKMDEGIDTGPIYAKKLLALDKTKNIHQLTQEYSEIGAQMLLEVLCQIENGSASLIAQTTETASYASRISAEDERINFSEVAACVHGRIMALTPTAYFHHQNLQIRALESILTNNYSDALPGTVISGNLDVVCGDGRVVKITKLQRAGGKTLEARAFLCGHKIPVGSVLTAFESIKVRVVD